MLCDKNHTFKIISLLIVLFSFTIHCFLPGDKSNKNNIDNESPVAYGQNVSTCVNTPVTITLQADDSDSEIVLWSISTSPQYGSITESFPQIVYTPATDFTGTDTFTFQASDGALLSNNAEIIVNVVTCVDTPVFQDDFSIQDSNWNWRIDGSAATTLVASGVELKVLAAADASAYSNAEIYESAGRLPWLRCRAVFRLQSPSIQLGSRGWGFWNGYMEEMSKSVMAWFTRVEGIGSAVPAGFYASTQSYGRMPVMTEITGVDLSQWHEFEVNWKADSVVYSIDGNVVVTHLFSPDRNMRLDVWTDNAVYNSSWAHVCQDPSADSTLIVDWIKVY